MQSAGSSCLRSSANSAGYVFFFERLPSAPKSTTVMSVTVGAADGCAELLPGAACAAGAVRSGFSSSIVSFSMVKGASRSGSQF